MPNAPSFAREFTRHALAHLPFRDVVDSAELLASELVTNPVEAEGLTMTTPVSAISRRHFIRLTLRVQGGKLYLDVWDAGDGTPTRQPVNEAAENGRGLLLVEMLSQRWGVTPSPRDGKTVWCVLARNSVRPTQDRPGEAPPPRPSMTYRPRPVPTSTLRTVFRPPAPLGSEDMWRLLVGLTRL
ncbi:ATP-binding protein [Nocardiopsis valliformis]|uniref:ATP-binding protein n=1 Tax=Nocardiopsis valliformis TaxID=239974 RepID=UPI001360B2D7|nr:ATP-binding protein [Nocardiopsis valliformis]